MNKVYVCGMDGDFDIFTRSEVDSLIKEAEEDPKANIPIVYGSVNLDKVEDDCFIVVYTNNATPSHEIIHTVYCKTIDEALEVEKRTADLTLKYCISFNKLLNKQ